MPARKIAPDMRRFSAYLPDAMLRWLEEKAKAEGVSINHLLRLAVEGLEAETTKRKRRRLT